MNWSRVLVVMMSLVPLFAAKAAGAQQLPPPVWTDILTSQGSSTMASGNTQYYFEIYPVLVGGGCQFQVVVVLPNFQVVYAAAVDVSSFGGSGILANDAGFCAGIASDTGYVSANIEPSSPAVSGSIPALPDSRLNVSLQCVFVGK